MSILQDNNQLWSTLDDAASVTSPRNGPGGSVVGATTTFIPVKFNDGIKSVNNGDYAIWSGLITTPNTYIAEWWLMPDGWFVTECDSSDNLLHEFYDTVGTSGFIQFQARNDSLFGPFISDGSNTLDLRCSSGVNIADGEKVHIVLVLDKNATFDGAKTAAWYLNGIQIVSSTTSMNWTANQDVIIGAEQGSFLRPSKAGIDNLKIYNAVSAALVAAVIANKDNEGFPLDGGFKLIDGSLKTPLLDTLLVN